MADQPYGAIAAQCASEDDAVADFGTPRASDGALRRVGLVGRTGLEPVTGGL